MTQNDFLRKVRKEYIYEDIVEVILIKKFHSVFAINSFLFLSFQDTELCPRCESNNEKNYLRFFFVNLDEAIYKCSSSKCLYPFKNFKFKNFKERSFYIYKPIESQSEEMQLKNDQFDIIDSIPADIASYFYNENETNPFATDTFTSNQMKAPNDDLNFDFLPSLFDSPLPSSQETNNTESYLNNLDAFLDDIIKEQSKSTASPAKDDEPPKTETEPQVEASVIAPKIEAETDTSLPAKKKISKKLTKCLEHIGKPDETMPKKKRSYVRKKKVEAVADVKIEKVETVDKVEDVVVQVQKVQKVEKVQVKTNVNQALIDLMNNKNTKRPTDLLAQLQNMGFIKFSSGPPIKSTIPQSPKPSTSTSTSTNGFPCPVKVEPSNPIMVPLAPQSDSEISNEIIKSEDIKPVQTEIKVKTPRKKKVEQTNGETIPNGKRKRKPPDPTKSRSRKKVKTENEILDEKPTNVINSISSDNIASDTAIPSEVSPEPQISVPEPQPEQIQIKEETNVKNETPHTEIIYPKTIVLSDSESDLMGFDHQNPKTKGKRRVSKSKAPKKRPANKKVPDSTEATEKQKVSRKRAPPKNTTESNQPTMNKSRGKKAATAAIEAVIDVKNELPSLI